MEKFYIDIERDGQMLHFVVIDYIHSDGKCKFEVYSNAKIVASFDPDKQGFLHLCKNPGQLDEEILHQIADKIESHQWWW